MQRNFLNRNEWLLALHKHGAEGNAIIQGPCPTIADAVRRLPLDLDGYTDFERLDRDATEFPAIENVVEDFAWHVMETWEPDRPVPAFCDWSELMENYDNSKRDLRDMKRQGVA